MAGPTPTPTPPPPLPPPSVPAQPVAAARPARYDFLNSKPPPNYVAGLGRGWFTTRSDIGPARAAPDLPDRSAAAAAAPFVGCGRGKPPGEDDGDDDGGDEEKGYDENQKFDEFKSNDAGLFSNADYDDDDREGDAAGESAASAPAPAVARRRLPATSSPPLPAASPTRAPGPTSARIALARYPSQFAAPL